MPSAHSEHLNGTSRVLLVAFAALTCCAGVHEGPQLGHHECINALAARESLRTGEWLIPKIGDTPKIRKTPLGIWLIGGSSYLLNGPNADRPVTELTARLPSAVAAFANVLLVWWLGSMLYGPRCGLTAGFIMAACGATIFFGRNAQVDMLLTMFTTLSFACFWRATAGDKGIAQAARSGAQVGAPKGEIALWRRILRPSTPWMAAFYVSLGLAMMAKAPLPLAIVGLSLAIYWFVAVPLRSATEPLSPAHESFVRAAISGFWEQVRRSRSLWLPPGLVVFLIVAGAWPLYVSTRVENAWALWRIEYLARFSGEMGDQVRSFWYYVPFIFGLTFPYMLSIPEASAAPFLAGYKSFRSGLLYVWSWALAGTVFLSASSFKRPHYLVSVVPAYCLLLAPVIDRLFFGETNCAGRGAKAACRILSAVLGVAVVAGVYWTYKIYPAMSTVYLVGGGAVLILWVSAIRDYPRNQRLASFTKLNLGIPLLVLLFWPAIGRSVVFNAEGQALAAGLREHGVKVGEIVYWVDGQEDTSIEFYAGYRIRRLIDELEMAELRRSRRTVSTEVYTEYARRIQEQLQRPEPVYLIVSAGRHQLLEQHARIASRVLFKLTGFHKDAEDDLVVITQPHLEDRQSSPVEGGE